MTNKFVLAKKFVRIVHFYVFFWKDTSLLHQLAIKDRQLILAAKCGKGLLEEKEELERQIDLLNHDYQQRIDVRL